MPVPQRSTGVAQIVESQQDSPPIARTQKPLPSHLRARGPAKPVLRSAGGRDLCALVFRTF